MTSKQRLVLKAGLVIAAGLFPQWEVDMAAAGRHDAGVRVHSPSALRRFRATILLFAFCLCGACNRPSRKEESRQQSETPDSAASQAVPSQVSAQHDTAPPARPQCPRAAGSPLRISEDSIDNWALDAALGTLRKRCLAAREARQYGESESYAGLAFPLDGLTATAIQYRDSLDANQPADAWSVEGTNGVLPNGVPMTASWAELRRAYGRGMVARGEVSLTAMFCAHERVFFTLSASPDVMDVSTSEDLSLIPDSTRVRDIGIFPRPNPTWHCEPRFRAFDTSSSRPRR